MILFDIAPSGGMIGAIVAGAFFLVLAGTAWVAFKALKKTAKMAIRLLVVVMILVIAVAGSMSLWWFSSDANPKLKPPAERKR
ncbi:MAG TPA: hypothetical protein VJV05_17895 [Pyrinomonadaceae bacterium]|nr:hypothetical protein [Pyrinomonadaceae bacterium]